MSAENVAARAATTGFAVNLWAGDSTWGAPDSAVRLETDLSRQKTEKVALESLLKEHQETIRQLKDSLNAVTVLLGTRSQGLTQVNAELAQLQGVVKARDETVQALTRRIQELEREKKNLCAEHVKRLIQVRKQVQAEERQAMLKLGEFTAAQSTEIQQANRDLVALKRQVISAEEKEKHFQAQIHQLQVQLASEKVVCNEQLDQIKALESEQRRLCHELNIAQEKIVALEAELFKVQGLNQKILAEQSLLKEKYLKLESESKQLAQQLASRPVPPKTVEKSFQVDLAPVPVDRKHAEELAKKKDYIRELEQKITILNGKIEQQKQDYQKLTKVAKATAESMKKGTAAILAIETLKQTNAKLERDKVSLIDQLDTEKLEAQLKVHEVDRTHQTLASNILVQGQRIKQLEADNKMLIAELAGIRAELVKWKVQTKPQAAPTVAAK